jgi:hypothetical protein
LPIVIFSEVEPEDACPVILPQKSEKGLAEITGTTKSAMATRKTIKNLPLLMFKYIFSIVFKYYYNKIYLPR